MPLLLIDPGEIAIGGDYRKVDANGDVVILDLEGPGCLNRIWLTGQKREKWNILIDGEVSSRFGQLTGESLDPNHPSFAFQFLWRA